MEEAPRYALQAGRSSTNQQYARNNFVQRGWAGVHRFDSEEEGASVSWGEGMRPADRRRRGSGCCEGAKHGRVCARVRKITKSGRVGRQKTCRKFSKWILAKTEFYYRIRWCFLKFKLQSMQFGNDNDLYFQSENKFGEFQKSRNLEFWTVKLQIPMRKNHMTRGHVKSM